MQIGKVRIVPSVVTWSKDSTKKPSNITLNNLEKMIVAIPELANVTWEQLNEGAFHKEISSFMSQLKKIDVDPEKVKSNLKRNCTLVVLSDKIIPLDIQEAFNTTHKDTPPTIANTNREGLLSGTKWWTNKVDYTPKSYDLFS